MRVFISYTTIDNTINKELLIRLYNKLSEFATVYIDLIHNDSLNKQKRVFEELESADQVLLIETKKVYQSNWVKAELERAKKLRKEIIKISYSELMTFLKPDININKIDNKRLLTTFIKKGEVAKTKSVIS